MNRFAANIRSSAGAAKVRAHRGLSAQVLIKLTCDDYLWSNEAPGGEDGLNSPKIAIDAFTTIFRRKLAYAVNARMWQFACVKTQD